MAAEDGRCPPLALYRGAEAATVSVGSFFEEIMLGQIKLIENGRLWMPTKDADPAARAIFKRHYSKYWYKDGRDPKQFIGPGEYICLVLSDYSALFVWRKFISKDEQSGVNCAVFRNESNILSSKLILEAEQWAWDKWPGERLYTYINPKKIRSTNPGYCFLVAGWRRCRVTKINRLLIMEKYPEEGD